MSGWILFGGAVTAALGLLLAWDLIARRVVSDHRERRRQSLEARLRPLAWELSEGAELEAPLGKEEMFVLGGIIQRLRARLTGISMDHLADFFEAEGFVTREMRALSSRIGWRRAVAAARLGDMGARAAIRDLETLLDDRREDVRLAAVTSLGKLKSAGSTSLLVAAMVDRTVPRESAADAINSIGPSAVGELVGQLSNPDPRVRALCLELLGFLGDAGHAGLAASRLRDTSVDVRAAAARTLGRLGDEKTAPDLRAALGDRISFVRAQAARSLGRLRDLSSIPLLLEQSNKPDFWEARAAAQALSRIDETLVLVPAERPLASRAILEAADKAALRW